MHPYATNSGERKMVVVFITVASILFAYALNRAVAAGYLPIPWWVDSPSVLGFFGLLYTTFDRWLWKLGLFRTIHLVKVPDLSGEWKGEVVSSHQEFATPHAVTVRIDQTWTALCVSLSGRHSDSESVMAAVLLPKPNTAVLTYQYKNEPHASAVGTMHAHKGTVWLNLSSEGGRPILEGDYYSGRDRQNIGRMKLQRQER